VLNAVLVQFGADDAELAGGVSAAGAQVDLTGDKVKVDPGAVFGCQNALGTQDDTVGAQIQLFQAIADKVHGELLVGLGAPGGEDLISMVVMMVMVVIVAAAVTVLIVVVVVMLMMVMIMAAAITMLVVIVVVMLMMLVVVIMVMVMMLMVVIMVMAAAGTMLVMLVVMVMCLGMLHLGDDLGNGCAALHGFLQLVAGQLTPGGGDDGGVGVMLLEHFHSGIQLLLGHGIGAGQNDAGSGLHLIVIKLTEILHIDLDLIGVHNRHGAAQGYIIAGDLLHSADHIGQLADTGRLDDDAVGVVLVNDLGQGTAEVANQTAANATGIHFGDVNACLLQETSINADLAKFVFDEDQFFALVALGDHLLDQGGFTGTQEAGVNIDFCHNLHLSFLQDQTYCILLNFT